jgi:Fur family peroxide stress response transcriptional regulator
MPVAEAEVERLLGVLVRALRTSGMRLTHQRLEVARELAVSDAHPDVETIYRRIRERIPTVSLDTVYRTVATLVDLGVVNRVGVLSGPARYDANTARHHHFVCSQCGLIRDVRDTALDALEPPEEALLCGTVELVNVQFHGTCRECRQTRAGGDSE